MINKKRSIMNNKQTNHQKNHVKRQDENENEEHQIDIKLPVDPARVAILRREKKSTMTRGEQKCIEQKRYHDEPKKKKMKKTYQDIKNFKDNQLKHRTREREGR